MYIKVNIKIHMAEVAHAVVASCWSETQPSVGDPRGTVLATHKNTHKFLSIFCMTQAIQRNKRKNVSQGTELIFRHQMCNDLIIFGVVLGNAIALSERSSHCLSSPLPITIGPTYPQRGRKYPLQ